MVQSGGSTSEHRNYQNAYNMKNMKTLEVFVAQDEASWVDEKYTADYDSIPKDELGGCSRGWYLHYELEHLVGFDIAYPTNCKSAGYAKATIASAVIGGNQVQKIYEEEGIRWSMYINGIIPVKVKGVDQPCIGYFWITDEHPIYYKGDAYPHWEQRGLICLESDTDGRADALKKYNEKRERV